MAHVSHVGHISQNHKFCQEYVSTLTYKKANQYHSLEAVWCGRGMAINITLEWGITSFGVDIIM